MALFGKSGQEKAQQLANETNYAIANEANQWNRWNLEYQNEWNLAQWERENAYNDPSAQMERLIKAGINPIVAAGDISSGIAQHLESGEPKAQEVAHMEPVYDSMFPQNVANLASVARDVVNGVQGFYGLDLQKQDVDTRRMSATSQIGLNRAIAAEKQASTVGKEIENNWNLTTFDVRSRAETQKLSNMQKQWDVMDKDSELAKSKKMEIDATLGLIQAQTTSVLEGIRQRDDEIRIAQQNANANSMNAESNAGRLHLEDERFNAQIKKWNNDSLMQFLYKFGRKINVSMSGTVGVEGLGVSGSAGMSETTPADIQRAKACGIEIISRYGDNPTPDSQRQAEEAARIVKALQDEQLRRSRYVAPLDALNVNTTNTSVLNPDAF